MRQEPQLGTGHALQQAAPLLDDDGITLVLNGDVPLIETRTLQSLVAAATPARLALLTIELDAPRGYGRIVRSGGAFAADAIVGIVEEKDATDAQRAIREVYTGVMAAPTRALKRWSPTCATQRGGEYYSPTWSASPSPDGTTGTGVAAAS